MAAEDFIISRKRKKYKFARFSEYPNCFEASDWQSGQPVYHNGQTVMELGAGTAVFLVEYARLHPERFFIAVDVKADRLQTGAKQALEKKISNIVFLRSHADQLVELIKPHSISELWLTFSDPYPKKRHAKHRLSDKRFLGIYRQLLATEGALHMKTDNLNLFQGSLEQLVSDGWRICELSHDLHADDRLPDEYRIITAYEKRFITDGFPIYYLTAVFG